MKNGNITPDIEPGVYEEVGKKCYMCDGTGIQNYGPNLEIDPSGADVTCDCDYCLGTGDMTKGGLTCVKCCDKDTCPFAFDAYNTSGDCLASK